MWKLLVDIVASAVVGYFVEQAAESVRHEARVLVNREMKADRGSKSVRHRPVHAVTYRQWVS